MDEKGIEISDKSITLFGKKTIKKEDVKCFVCGGKPLWIDFKDNSEKGKLVVEPIGLCEYHIQRLLESLDITVECEKCKNKQHVCHLDNVEYQGKSGRRKFEW